MGDAYYYGRAGLPVDFERAAKYYQAAAELRQPQAMFNLVRVLLVPLCRFIVWAVFFSMGRHAHPQINSTLVKTPPNTPTQNRA